METFILSSGQNRSGTEEWLVGSQLHPVFSLRSRLCELWFLLLYGAAHSVSSQGKPPLAPHFPKLCGLGESLLSLKKLEV